METDAGVEHIFLSSELEDAPPAERTDNVRFDQRGRLRRCEAHFTVFNDHFIEVETRGLSSSPRHFELDLAFLDPSPERIRRIAWREFLVAGILLVSAYPASTILQGQVNAVLLALLISAGLVSLWLGLRRSRNRIIFFSRHGRAPLLILLNGNPSAKALNAFVEDLITRITRAGDDRSGSRGFLNAELRQHRRLMEQGSLSEKGYELVKRRILRLHQ